MDQQNIKQGVEVRSSDGEKLGKVVGTQGQYVVVEKGFFFPTDYYVPSSAISSTTDDAIHLSVSKDQALNSGWDQAPITDTASSSTATIGSSSTATTGSASATGATTPSATSPGATTTGTPATGAPVTGTPTTGASTTAAATPGATTTGATTTGATTGDVGIARSASSPTGEDVLRVPVYEEELTATKRGVDRGEVRVEKDIVMEERVLDVPVTEEQVNVTRRTVDREVTADETAFQEGTIDIPVRGEEVDMEKRVREVEEVDIAKEAVQSTKRVEGTVRREQVHIEGDTVDTGDTTGAAPSS